METQNEKSSSYLDQIKEDSTLKAAKEHLANYKENQGKGSNSSQTSDQRLAKYFTPMNDSESFRALPPPAGLKSPIMEAFFHVADVTHKPGQKRKTKIYCPARNNPLVEKKDENGKVVVDKNDKPILVPQQCSLCDKRKEMLKTQDQSIRGKKKEDLQTDAEKAIYAKNLAIFKEASTWEAKKFYILRGIDMGKQKDGVKFWRYKHNFANKGVMDKLLPVLSTYMEDHSALYYDPLNGSTLEITTTQQEYMGRPYRDVTMIIAKKPSKLHEDDKVIKDWLNDPITWRDVYKPKTAPNITPEEYIDMLMEGKEPYYDDITDAKNKHWVFPGRPDLEEKANQRNADLDGDNNENIERASDLSDDGSKIAREVAQNTVQVESAQTAPTAEPVAETTPTVTPTVEETKPVEVETAEPKVEETPPAVEKTSTEEPSGPEEEFDDLPF